MRDESIMDIVRACAPGRSDLVVLMHAYFDESGEGEFLIVGGFVFRKSQIRPFEKKWARMLADYKLPFFRMAPANSGKFPFDKLSKPEVEQCAKRALDIVIEFADHAYYCAVRPSDFHEIVGKKGFFRTPYAFCSYMCMLGVGGYFKINSPGSLISYFFEAGDPSQGLADAAISNLGGADNGREMFLYRSHAFLKKEHSYPTQAGDIMAWQSHKHLKRMRDGLKEPRGDYKAIVEGVGLTYCHASREFLKALVETINRTGGGRGAGELAGYAIHNERQDVFKNRALQASIVRG